MIPELEKALNTCNVDELAAILAHDPSLINVLNDKGVPYAFVGAMQESGVDQIYRGIYNGKHEHQRCRL